MSGKAVRVDYFEGDEPVSIEYGWGDAGMTGLLLGLRLRGVPYGVTSLIKRESE